jgi:hypothetical protein
MNLDRARRIAALLDDQDVREAFETIERDILAEWRSAIDAEKREACWHDMGALMRLRARLKGFAGDLRKAEPRGDRTF